MTGELNRRENEVEETELNLTELRMKCSIREELQSYDRREFPQRSCVKQERHRFVEIFIK